jgi:hypothetical protein
MFNSADARKLKELASEFEAKAREAELQRNNMRTKP